MGRLVGISNVLESLPLTHSFPVPNQWQESIQVGRMMSSCRPKGASEETKILNQRESTALVADTGLGTGTGWSSTSTSGRILVKSTTVGRANVAGPRGRHPRVGDTVETEGVPILTVTDGGARFR